MILSLLLRELKKGETFASLLNIHGGDIRVVPTHLVFFAVGIAFLYKDEIRRLYEKLSVYVDSRKLQTIIIYQIYI